MKKIFVVIAVAGLLLMLVPALTHLGGSTDESTMKELMFVGTMLWFAGAIPWLGQKKPSPAN